MEKTENGSDSTDLGRDWVLDVIILENVFYGRNCSSIYDLKGSQRGRFNDEAEKKTGDKRGVYLDMNLRKHNASDPPLLVDQATLNRLGKHLLPAVNKHINICLQRKRFVVILTSW